MAAHVKDAGKLPSKIDDFKLDSLDIEKNKWGYLQPRINFKPGPFWSMPPTIDPKNWTPITSKEQRAHNERQMIRGRLRREMWSRAYHPDYWMHFNGSSDIAAIRYTRTKTVWHIKESARMSDKATLGTFLLFLMVPFSLTYAYYDACSHQQTILERIGKE